jgi:hypothetical protein
MARPKSRDVRRIVGAPADVLRERSASEQVSRCWLAYLLGAAEKYLTIYQFSETSTPTSRPHARPSRHETTVKTIADLLQERNLR